MLALHPLGSVDVVDDGLDTLFGRREVRVLRQALKRVGEVDAGVLERHLGEHLGQGAPAEPPSVIGQIGRSFGAELLQGVEDALEEQGQPGIGAHVRLLGVPNIRHAHDG